MSISGIVLLIALALVYTFAAAVHYSKRKCPHCGHAGVTPHFDEKGTSDATTCDHCGEEV